MISIYKPNKSNSGCACSFSISKDGVVFINAVQQASWDEANKTGSFADNAKNPEKSISVKLNGWECGSLIRSIEEFSDMSMFHTYKEDKTIINFKRWVKKDETKAFGLSISRNSNMKFQLPIEYSEAIVIREFLKFALLKSFEQDIQNQNKE